MNRAAVATVVLACALAGAAVALVLAKRSEAPREPEQATLFETPRPLPAFDLVDQAGRPFDRASLAGHWTFLFFGFVNCPDVCPTTLATLAEVRQSVADLPATERPRVVLATVDPMRDTPEVLARYLAHFDPTFTGMTGSPDSVTALTRELGVAVIRGTPAADGSYSVDHSAAIFLVDPQTRISALFGAPHEAGTIARDYRSILASRSG